MSKSFVHGGRVQYRPDVDGLRAVAVLSVLLFHMGAHFYGGYVGVDVFFVISGYLISAVVMADFAAGNFSLASFYERRIRRIFPALLVTLAVTTVLVYRYFTPAETEAYATSLLATLFSGSNFLFWSQAGYFDDPSITKPLLHTWSLAVEEQFYLLFPLLLVLVHRFFPARLKPILLFLTVGSLAAAIVTVRYDATAAFFFTPLRAWELLMGTIVSQRWMPAIKGSVARNVASSAGLLMVLYAAMRFTERTPFPGLAALLPCVGAALIIAAGETGSSMVGAVLSSKPFVFVGLISYSLYLIHWPLLVFQGTSSIFFAEGELTTVTRFAFAALAIAMAALSWKFVEQPFRKGRFRPGRPTLFWMAGGATAVLSLAAAGLLVSHGLPNRFPLAAQKVASFTQYDRGTTYRDGICYLNGKNSFSQYRPEVCLQQHEGKRSVLVIGDSHSAQLIGGLTTAYPEYDVLQASASACRPWVTQPKDARAPCRQLFKYIYDDFLAHHHVDTLLVAARWSSADFAHLPELIDFARAKGIDVVLIGPSIEYDLNLPRLIAISLRDGQIDRVEKHRSLEPQNLDMEMGRLAATDWHVKYISMYGDLCTPQCPLYAAPDVPLLFDTDHFTPLGSLLLAETIRKNGQLP